jgi:polar amino acid transport system substrate-binding protein
MRRLLALALLAVLAGIAAGCGGGDNESAATTNTTSTSANACAKDQLNLVTPGVLTVATGNPSYPPWFEGGTTKGSTWKITDPNNDQGFEGALTYALARQLGFTNSEVEWKPIAFNQTYRPGPKDYDFSIQQIGITPQRATAVDFSDPYFDLNQSIVAIKGTPITSAKTFSDLKQYRLGAAVGTTSYDYIVDNIEPDKDPRVYDDLNQVITALKNKQIDGLVTDFPGAYYIAFVQLSNGDIVGQLPTIGETEHFGMTFEKGNSLVDCVNKALATLKQDGTLQQLEQQWIIGKAQAPLIQQG